MSSSPSPQKKHLGTSTACATCCACATCVHVSHVKHDFLFFGEWNLKRIKHFDLRLKDLFLTFLIHDIFHLLRNPNTQFETSRKFPPQISSSKKFCTSCAARASGFFKVCILLLLYHTPQYAYSQ